MNNLQIDVDLCSLTFSRVAVALIILGLCSSQDNNEFYTEWEESYDSFDQMQLHENLLRGIYAYGEALQQQTACLLSLACFQHHCLCRF